MERVTVKLKTPTTFDFPYEPYPIQKEFMSKIFYAVSEKKVAIFESPTGTGKTLTILTGVLTWLDAFEKQHRISLGDAILKTQNELKECQKKHNSSPNWISGYEAISSFRQRLKQLQKQEKLLDKYMQEKRKTLERGTKIKQTMIHGGTAKSRRATVKRKASKHTSTAGKNTNASNGVDEYDEFYLNSDSDEEESSDLDSSDLQPTELSKYHPIQIFYCSRTHSQLSQVIEELKKTNLYKKFRFMTLGSRQQLCINDNVRKLNSVSLINERCLDLTKSNQSYSRSCKKPRLSTTNNCPFKNAKKMQELSDYSSGNVMDIEDLCKEGKNLKACPYYAAREAQADADFVLMPYQMLLHKNTRLQNNIKIANSVIIIDEAHNLVDTMVQLYSIEITIEQLQHTLTAMKSYKDRYSERMNSDNLLYFNQLAYIMKRIIGLCETKLVDKQAVIMKITEFASEADFFNLKLDELIDFCKRTRLAQKLQGYIKYLQMHPDGSLNETNAENEPHCSKLIATKNMLHRLETQKQSHVQKREPKRKLEQESKEPKTDPDSNTTNDTEVTNATAINDTEHKSNDYNHVSSCLPSFLTFLESLCSLEEDGRVLLTPHATKPGETQIKYLVLDLHKHFGGIVKQARSIIMIGGTMQPTGELKAQLLPDISHRIIENTFMHVISPDSVLSLAIRMGPSNVPLSFTYTNRSCKKTLNQLTIILTHLCDIVPEGLICFLPSYKYLEEIYEHLERTNALDEIQKRKSIFREHNSSFSRSKSCGQTIEALLNQYAAAIRKPKSKGALLFSVVGGKLSEGLNFKDELARGVIIVGLPFPNNSDPELKERMNYLEEKFGENSGVKYYQNLCMKAVNQSIGRAIRHINDYAAIFLIDYRYGCANILNQLPHWIAPQIISNEMFDQIETKTKEFYERNQLKAIK